MRRSDYNLKLKRGPAVHTQREGLRETPIPLRVESDATALTDDDQHSRSSNSQIFSFLSLIVVQEMYNGVDHRTQPSAIITRIEVMSEQNFK